MRGLLLVVLTAWSSTAEAHQTSVKYIDLVLDGTRVEVTMRFGASDVTEPLGVEPSSSVAIADVVAHPGVGAYVQRWLVITNCPTASPPRLIAADATYLSVTWSASCEHETSELVLDFSAFFALDTRHEALVRLTGPGATPIQTIVRAGDSPLPLHLGQSPSLMGWIRSGMDHIYGGLDHVLFVLTLLLVVMLHRDPDWQLRRFVPMLRSTAVVITAFTIGHSMSLIAAALGYVELPSQLVESLIALSIVYTATENAVRPDVTWRYVVTFAFGLVHGLGFASVLAELLPPSDVVVPLLCFNAGVELGQLTIVAVALPVFYGIARLLGAPRYRRIALPIASAALGLVGLAMLAERIFETRILPFG